MLQAIFLSFLGSLVVAAAAAPFLLPVLRRIKAAQTVSSHLPEHQAKQGTPTMGGLIILLGALAGILIGGGATTFSLAPVLLLIGFGLVGFADDYLVPKMKPGSRGFDWKPKLLLQAVVGLGALWISGVRDAGLLGAGLFLILFFSNAYNFADGLDGLAGSLGLILFAAVILMLPLLAAPAVESALWGLAPVAAAVAAGFLPFLWLNAPPAKVFMGDVGALALGGALGT
ncbi:MAG: hypothetical protein MH204_02100, partial [Fimbriimonadaceae bacterium]|nr:hypothetical protein [Fimbriimonadaceae bacterium]